MAKLIKRGIPENQWNQDRTRPWYSDIRLDGKRVRRALSKHKPEAQKLLRDMIELRRSRRRGETPKNVSWDFFKTDSLRKSRVNDKIETFYANRRAFELVDAVTQINQLNQMTPERLIEIDIRLKEKKYPPVTIARSVRAIVTAMRRAEDLKYVSPQNWRIVKIIEPKARLDFYEFENYLQLLSRLTGVWRTSAWLMGRAGLRLGEALHLEWRDIQFANHRLIFRSKPEYNWNIKGDKTGTKIRAVPLTRDLQGHLESIAKPQGFVLGDDCSRTREVYGKQVSRALAATGVYTYLGKFGFPHILRHTFGSHLAQAGVYEGTIAELMGHSTTKMVKIYSHLRPVDLKQGIAMLPEVGSIFGGTKGNGSQELVSTLGPLQSSIQPSTALLGTLGPNMEHANLSSETSDNSH